MQEHLLELKSSSQSYLFEGVDEEPVLSVNRDFTAPVTISMPQSDQERAFLLAHDANSFPDGKLANNMAVTCCLAWWQIFKRQGTGN